MDRYRMTTEEKNDCFSKAKVLMDTIILKSTRETSLAVTKLQECIMWINAAPEVAPDWPVLKEGLNKS